MQKDDQCVAGERERLGDFLKKTWVAPYYCSCNLNNIVVYIIHRNKKTLNCLNHWKISWLRGENNCDGQ
jgi:hypothetical protein